MSFRSSMAATVVPTSLRLTPSWPMNNLRLFASSESGTSDSLGSIRGLAGVPENLIQRRSGSGASVLVEAVRIEGSAFIDFFFRCLANGRIEGTRWGKQDRGV